MHAAGIGVPRREAARVSVRLNGDIPRFLANGDRPARVAGRRRAGRSSGRRGRLGLAERLPRVDSLCSLKVARASKIAGRQFSAAARRKPTGLNVCRNGCAEMHRGGPYWASSSPRSIRSQRESAVGGVPPTGAARSPPCQPAPPGPQLRSAAGRSQSRMFAGAEPDHRLWRSVPAPGHAAMARRRGSQLRINGEACGAGLRADGDRAMRVGAPSRRLTRSATEWSAARRKPVRAAAMHLSAAISADVKARRLPTSGRRKFPSGNFRSARDFEGAKRVSRGQACPPT